MLSFSLICVTSRFEQMPKNMFLSKAAILIAFALGAIGAHFRIPEIENTVSDVVREYSHGITFQGNESDGFDFPQQVAASYWLENITHQGISAFGPSGYQVFRNVKDFGAKGTFLFTNGF
jgi:glucan 1,3-beta-glucosidase